jgi:hypothetical protein
MILGGDHMDPKNCKHKWIQVPKHSMYGVVHQDECEHCGSIGVLSEKPDENGFYQIIPQPFAEVIDLNEYREKRKAVANG